MEKKSRGHLAVLRIRDRAGDTRKAWVAKVQQDPMCALEWSRDGVRAVVTFAVCSDTLQGFENGATDEQVLAFVTRDLLSKARFPVASTGLLDAELQGFRCAALAEIVEALRDS